jgi:hypothetical protein
MKSLGVCAKALASASPLKRLSFVVPGGSALPAGLALFGFLNRFNDTMATELESSPIAAGQRFLAARGWTVGKHAR